MHEFRDTAGHDSGNDPLERIVEAFVGQSAPDGPDAATRRRLLAAMFVADRDPAKAAGSAGGHAAKQPVCPPALRTSSRRQSWPTFFVRQAAGLAAAVLLVAAGALLAMSLRKDAQPPTAPAVDVLVADVDVVAADPTGPQELVRVVESYLRAHGNESPDRDAVKTLIADLLRDNPRLAEVDSWRLAQARLSDALEQQPEVFGVGVGLLGTLPWTTRGRF